MTTRNLSALFHPTSVALIGASNRLNSVGAVIAKNLREAGFEGAVLPVNPKHRAVAGVLCYPDIASLPLAPDLAIICTPAQTVPSQIDELGKRGTRAAIVISAGFRELGDKAGAELQNEMLAAAKPSLLRIVGPNCLGIVSTPEKLNASFALGMSKPGNVAFVAQSGAMVTTVLDWASGRGIGFSHMISLGDMSDVDFGDVLNYLATDENTNAIVLYIEAVTAARKFISAARAASRVKPVIAIKAGREAAGARAAASHTGALAGADAVYDAAFERAGILRVFDLDEVFDAVETLATRPHITGDKLAILTNGGGVGVLATDALISQGGELAVLSQDTLAQLNRALPSTWSHGNPIDIIGDADATRYAASLEVVADAKETDAVLVLNCPVAVASNLEAAKAVTEFAASVSKPILTSWLGGAAAFTSRKLFESKNIPTYDTPEKGVRGFMHMVRYRRGQDALMEVPASVPSTFEPDVTKARRLIDTQLESSDGWLNAQAVFELLTCYGIPAVRTALVTTIDDAARSAGEFQTPVALKIQSREILHKSDVGGVALDLVGVEAVKMAAKNMIVRVQQAVPKAHIDGFVVQEMIRRPDSYELILGMAEDPTFGPFMLFGSGGTAVEVINDKALGLPPLNLKLARNMMERTRIWRQLKGFRDQPPVDANGIAVALVQLSRLICDFDEIAEVDINPLLADQHGAMALDARIRVQRTIKGGAHDRVAIRPYPKELETAIDVAKLGRFSLRPVRPEDAEAFTKLAAHESSDDIRMRFFSSFHTVPKPLLARLTQIDYDREMAFVLLDKKGDAAGVSRLVADPDGAGAEFAILIRTDLKRRGLGRALMRHLIGFARSRGIATIFGDVLVENAAMLGLCRELGANFSIPSGGVTHATLSL